MEKVKKASESLTVMTNIVLPNETNSLRNLFGGELLAKMDRCASISAARHCARRVVTASVNHVSFNHPIPEGGIVILESKVSRAFSTSRRSLTNRGRRRSRRWKSLKTRLTPPSPSPARRRMQKRLETRFVS